MRNHPIDDEVHSCPMATSYELLFGPTICSRDFLLEIRSGDIPIEASMIYMHRGRPSILFGELYRVYLQWAGVNGVTLLKPGAFNSAMGRAESPFYKSIRNRLSLKGRYYRVVSFKPDMHNVVVVDGDDAHTLHDWVSGKI
jgi:hypothetical protein